MSLLDEINDTNDAQIRAIDEELTRLRIEIVELKHARSILVGRRRRLGKDRDNGQSELPFEPASATVVTEHLARVEREAEEEGDAAEHRLAQVEREAEGCTPEDVQESVGKMNDWINREPALPASMAPDVEPRLRRRRGVERG
jgi:hypothetical protein